MRWQLTRDQAKRVWGDACAMGEKSPDISERLEILKTKVVHRERGGWNARSLERN